MILNNLKLTNYKQYAALSLDFRSLQDFVNNLYLCQKIIRNGHRIYFRAGTGHRKPKRSA